MIKTSDKRISPHYISNIFKDSMKLENSPVNPEKKIPNLTNDFINLQKRQNASSALSEYKPVNLFQVSPTWVSSNWSNPHSKENTAELHCFKKAHILFYKLMLSHTENSVEWDKLHFSLCCSFIFSSKPQLTQTYNFKLQSLAQNAF